MNADELEDADLRRSRQRETSQRDHRRFGPIRKEKKVESRDAFDALKKEQREGGFYVVGVLSVVKVVYIMLKEQNKG